MQFQKFTPKTKQLAKILSDGRSSQIVNLKQASGTSDTKILPKGYQLRRGECVPYFVNHRRFHKWLIPIFSHFYKRVSSARQDALF